MPKANFSHILTLLLALSLPLASSAAELDYHTLNVEISSSSPEDIALAFQPVEFVNEVLTRDGTDYDAFAVPGEGVVLDYGKPVLPSVTRFVVVPPRSGLALEVTADEPVRIPGRGEPVVYTEEDAGSMFEEFDDNGLYPPVFATMSEPVIIRGVRLVKVTTYPIQYESSTNTYLRRDHIDAQVRYTDNEPVNPAGYTIEGPRSRYFLTYIRNLAINGDEVGRDDPDYDSDPPYIAHYLVAIHENCQQYAAPFIEWRRKAGYKVDILRLSSNEANNDNTVKNRIQQRWDAYVDNGETPFDLLLIVGDRQNYYYSQNAQWILRAPRGNPTWGNDNHADYLFACMDGGGDHHPDVGYSRWHSGAQNLMELAVGRTLAYEAYPYMEETDWFTRGGVYSQHWGNAAFRAWHITIHTNVRWSEEVLQHLGFDEIHFYENYQYDRMGQSIGPEIRDWLNEGLNVMIGRAENYYWRQGFNGVNENVVFPINICASGHGEWCAESMTRTGSGNSLKGPVAMTYGWGNPQYTMPISANWASCVSGVLQHDMPLGWARAYGITDPEQYIDNNNYVLNWKTEFDCFGDPGIQPWIGVPRIVEAEFPDRISPETRMVEVQVFDPDDDSPVGGAQVTLYAPGDMPGYNQAAYANYDDMFMVTKKSDEEGLARFVFDEAVEFETGDMFVTVTGRDIKPFFGEMDIRAERTVVEIDGYELTEQDGNDNDRINPGETFTISITAINLSDRNDLEEVTAVVSSLSPWVEVEENEISFGDIAAEETADGEGEATLHISPSCPDGNSRPVTKPKLAVVFSAGDDIWRTAVELEPQAPHFKVRSVVGGNTIDFGANDLDIDIENIGSAASGAFIAELSTLGMGVGVVTNTADYESLGAGDHAGIEGEPFVVSGNQIAIPGSPYSMRLIITTEDDFVDTLFFELKVEEERRNAPTGPDKYGYICFDDTDEDWDIAPEFEWIEISPRADDPDFEGTACDFDDDEQYDIGESEVVELGFETQFYGELFDRITIGSNGFIALGDQGRITNFQNWPMDRAIGGGAGMIAALWDDLALPDGSGVYYYYDEDDDRFIVEWHELRHRNGGNRDLIFQVILYDHDVWVTETGDQNVLVQYKSVTNASNVRQGQYEGAWRYNIPYASVGISSPDGASGINYTYNNDYPISAAPLENERAILYATSPRFRSGYIFGHVYDAENDRPVEEATVLTQHGFIAQTDEDGFYELIDALAGVEFEISAYKQGYNDSTRGGFELPEDDTLEIDFHLLHPEFTPDQELISDMLDVDESSEREFSVHNGGNGPLSWRVERRLRGEAEADPWELRGMRFVGDVVEDDRIEGAVFVDDKFYVSGSHDREPMIYIFDEEGELLDQFDQPGEDDRGMRDLAWDGELIWGTIDEHVYGITIEGEVVTHFEGPFRPITTIAYDPDRDVLWMSSTTTDIIAMTRDGEELEDRELDRQDLRIYGLAYWEEDPDGYPLYIFHKDRNTNQQAIAKYDPDAEEMQHVRFLEPEIEGSPNGAFITNQIDVYSWVLVAVSSASRNDGGDRIDIWQLDVRRDWFQLEPTAGVLNTGETEDFTLTLDATGLPAVTFEADLAFFHNASGGRTNIAVELIVTGALDNRILRFDEGWNMVSLNVELEEGLEDVPTLLQPLVEREILTIVKDEEGRFFRPEFDFNNIPAWNIAEGYLVHVTQPAELEIIGEVMPFDQPIPLDEGWNYVSYYPMPPIDAMIAFGGIVDRLIIAKDVHGDFYMPEFNFSNMGDLQQGQGYQVKVSEQVELSYQRGEEVASPLAAPELPEHFASPVQTGANMSLLALGGSNMAGWELAAFSTAGELVGSGRFDVNGRCGLAVWGDNPSMERSGKIASGEPFTLRIWDGSEEQDAHLANKNTGELTWSRDGVVVGNPKTGSAAPVAFGIRGAFPNPANGPVRFVFGVEEAADATLKLYDLAGREVTTLFHGQAKAGYHQVVWNTTPVPSGIYLTRLEAGGRVQTRKVAVLK